MVGGCSNRSCDCNIVSFFASSTLYNLFIYRRRRKAVGNALNKTKPFCLNYRSHAQFGQDAKDNMQREFEEAVTREKQRKQNFGVDLSFASTTSSAVGVKVKVTPDWVKVEVNALSLGMRVDIDYEKLEAGIRVIEVIKVVSIFPDGLLDKAIKFHCVQSFCANNTLVDAHVVSCTTKQAELIVFKGLEWLQVKEALRNAAVIHFRVDIDKVHSTLKSGLGKYEPQHVNWPFKETIKLDLLAHVAQA